MDFGFHLVNPLLTVGTFLGQVCFTIVHLTQLGDVALPDKAQRAGTIAIVVDHGQKNPEVQQIGLWMMQSRAGLLLRVICRVCEYAREYQTLHPICTLNDDSMLIRFDKLRVAKEYPPSFVKQFSTAVRHGMFACCFAPAGPLFDVVVDLIRNLLTP